MATLVLLAATLCACDSSAPSDADTPAPQAAPSVGPATATPAPKPTDPLEAFDPKVARAARVAAAIEAEPGNVDATLASLQLDRESLDRLMFEIADDPDLTQQYRIARATTPTRR